MMGIMSLSFIFEYLYIFVQKICCIMVRKKNEERAEREMVDVHSQSLLLHILFSTLVRDLLRIYLSIRYWPEVERKV